MQIFDFHFFFLLFSPGSVLDLGFKLGNNDDEAARTPARFFDAAVEKNFFSKINF